jgi:N-acetyl-gamma-glutamyl-phosphate reductase
MKLVYVDGQHGTTGLEIKKMIEKHPHLRLLELEYALRHDASKRKALLNQCDIAILCLPDDGSREAVTFIENPNVVVIDTSTAHRTNEDWCYGLPEFSSEQSQAIKTAKRIANPGCHATAAILLLKPLLEAGLISNETPLKMTSITGYSGGGKQMIADFEAGETLPPRYYAMGLSHKHIPEMMHMLALKRKPIFLPVVGAYKRGIALTLPLEKIEFLKPVDVDTLIACFQDYYKESEFAYVHPEPLELLTTETKDFGNRFEINVSGNEAQFLLTIKLDNLGKGAGGAAIQSINLINGWDLNLGI